MIENPILLREGLNQYIAESIFFFSCSLTFLKNISEKFQVKSMINLISEMKSNALEGK